MILLQILAFLLGVVIITITLLSAVRAFVLPRSAQDPIMRVHFRTMRQIFHWIMGHMKSYEERDQLFAFYAPLTLLLLLPVWLIGTLIGFALLFWAMGISSLTHAFMLSGSSLLTLGFVRGTLFTHDLLSFIEATIGLILVALLIAYLPTMYAAFSERERLVTLLDTYANTPPSAVEMILRMNRIGRLADLNEFWDSWSDWFAQIAESHTSLAPLVFFRSPRPYHSWITASGAVLDAGALFMSVVELPWNPRIAICLRAGYIALRYIADFFQIPYNADPHFPDDPIAVSRAEFDVAYDSFVNARVPVKADREQAWSDFAGWRVNYDSVLLALASLTMSPHAQWSSDRAPKFRLRPNQSKIEGFTRKINWSCCNPLRMREGHTFFATHNSHILVRGKMDSRLLLYGFSCRVKLPHEVGSNHLRVDTWESISSCRF